MGGKLVCAPIAVPLVALLLFARVGVAQTATSPASSADSALLWQLAPQRQSCTQFCTGRGGCFDANFVTQSLSSLANVVPLLGLNPTTIACGQSLLTGSDVCTDVGSTAS